MAKIVVNDKKEYTKKLEEVTFVIIYNEPHLMEKNILYM